MAEEVVEVDLEDMVEAQDSTVEEEEEEEEEAREEEEGMAVEATAEGEVDMVQPNIP